MDVSYVLCTGLVSHSFQVKILPLFTGENKFLPTVGSQTLDFEDIVVYYVDEKPPTFTMKRLTGGVIAVIVVVILAVAAGLLVLVSLC